MKFLLCIFILLFNSFAYSLESQCKFNRNMYPGYKIKIKENIVCCEAMIKSCLKCKKKANEGWNIRDYCKNSEKCTLAGNIIPWEDVSLELSCKRGYEGTPVVADDCNSDGEYVLSGCSKKTSCDELNLIGIGGTASFKIDSNGGCTVRECGLGSYISSDKKSCKQCDNKDDSFCFGFDKEDNKEGSKCPKGTYKGISMWDSMCQDCYAPDKHVYKADSIEGSKDSSSCKIITCELGYMHYHGSAGDSCMECSTSNGLTAGSYCPLGAQGKVGEVGFKCPQGTYREADDTVVHKCRKCPDSAPYSDLGSTAQSDCKNPDSTNIFKSVSENLNAQTFCLKYSSDSCDTSNLPTVPTNIESISTYVENEPLFHVKDLEEISNSEFISIGLTDLADFDRNYLKPMLTENIVKKINKKGKPKFKIASDDKQFQKQDLRKIFKPQGSSANRRESRYQTFKTIFNAICENEDKISCTNNDIAEIEIPSDEFDIPNQIRKGKKVIGIKAGNEDEPAEIDIKDIVNNDGTIDTVYSPLDDQGVVNIYNDELLIYSFKGHVNGKTKMLYPKSNDINYLDAGKHFITKLNVAGLEKNIEIITGSILIGLSSSCQPGEYLADNDCVKCPTNSYSSGGSVEQCTLCPANTETNNINQYSQIDCSICSAGYVPTGTNNECEECPTGQWSIPQNRFVVSAGTCDSCAELYFRSTSTEDCKPCSNGYTNPEGNSDISSSIFFNECALCDEDYYWDGDSCEACPENQHNSHGTLADGPAEMCNMCAEHHRVDVNGNCVRCPTGHTHLSHISRHLLSRPKHLGFTETYCKEWICEEDEYVVNNVCTKCPSGTSNKAGDSAKGSDTVCNGLVIEPEENIVTSEQITNTDNTQPDLIIIVPFAIGVLALALIVSMCSKKKRIIDSSKKYSSGPSNDLGESLLRGGSVVNPNNLNYRRGQIHYRKARGVVF